MILVYNEVKSKVAHARVRWSCSIRCVHSCKRETNSFVSSSGVYVCGLHCLSNFSQNWPNTLNRVDTGVAVSESKHDHWGQRMRTKNRPCMQ